jgi:anthranilate phosphoribosyltransferase
MLYADPTTRCRILDSTVRTAVHQLVNTDNDDMNAKQILEKLIDREDLSIKEADWLMTRLMEGDLPAGLMAGILIALRMKGESVGEITAFARVMREKSTQIPILSERLIDTCGTGGDSSGSFNISTTVALLLAGGGYRVAKHGNRSMTSKSGSADVLEALGLNIYITPEQVAECIERTGFGFLFAPSLHLSMKNVVPVRKDLAVRTIFNILGPLTNPANARTQTIGLFSTTLVPKIIAVLKELGLRSAYTFCGLSGLDEVCIAGETVVASLDPVGHIHEFRFRPEEYGFHRATLDDIRGGDAAANADICLKILKNEMKGPKRDIVVINAGFAIAAADNTTIADGITKADRLLVEKAGLITLEKLKALSQHFAR